MGIRCRPKIWRIGKFRIWAGPARYEIEQKSIAQKKAILDTKVFGPMDTPPQRPGKPASGRRKSREWEISQTGVLAAAAGRPRASRPTPGGPSPVRRPSRQSVIVLGVMRPARGSTLGLGRTFGWPPEGRPLRTPVNRTAVVRTGAKWNRLRYVQPVPLLATVFHKRRFGGVVVGILTPLQTGVDLVQDRSVLVR